MWGHWFTAHTTVQICMSHPIVHIVYHCLAKVLHGDKVQKVNIPKQKKINVIDKTNIFEYHSKLK